MTGDDAARRALARLARTDRDGQAAGESARATGDEHGRSYRETIHRATSAVDDVEDAARFVDDIGLDELEAAVERAENSVSACADDGRRALEQFREFREAASGDYFHPGRGSSLGGGDIARSK